MSDIPYNHNFPHDNQLHSNQLHHNNNNNNGVVGQQRPVVAPEDILLQNNNNNNNINRQGNFVNNSRSRNSASNINNPFSASRQSLTWSRVPLSPNSSIPPPRSGAASVVVKNRLYMFGGYGGGTGRLDDFYSFDFSSNTWEEVQVLSGVKPGCRENNGVVIGDSSRVYLFGGYNGTAWLNDLWMFDIDTKQWECIQESTDFSTNDQFDSAAGTFQNQIPSRRFGYVSVVHNHKFVLFGGFDGTRWLNDMYEFDFSTKTWTEIHASGSLPSVRSCPAWAKDENYVYIQGGYDGVERKADFFACNLSTYTWMEMPTRGSIQPSPRYFHSCCLYGTKMYLYGGYSGSERLSDMYAYDFETNVWSQVLYFCEDHQRPSGRSSLVAQVYENSLYIFGGYNGVTVLNDFYKFRLVPVSIPPSLLVHDLAKLVNSEEMSDVTFLVENQRVFANKAILAARSDYFKALLFNKHMKESLTKDEVIELKDVPYKVFLKVLEYLYTDALTDLNLELSIPLLIISERFMLDRLKRLCEDSIRRDITADNVISIFLASHRHNAIALKDIALDFILNNLHQNTVVNSLSQLKSEPDLLVEIIKRHSTLQPSTNNNTNNISQVSFPNMLGGPFGGSSEWHGTRR